MSLFDMLVPWHETVPAEHRAMVDPVRCTCGCVYDTATVTVTSRHIDCSVWKAPCCGVTADDRRFCHQPYARLRQPEMRR